MLTLRIENVDRLADGGPLSYQADRRGFDFGRDQHLDWTLPDAYRHVSRKHCEIRYFDSAYWLYDVSTGGTYVNKSTRRIQSPYRLNDGDQLAIGEYIISVTIAGEPALPDTPPPRAASPVEPEQVDDVWASTSDMPPPISPFDLMKADRRGTRAADFLSRIVDVPMPAVRPGAHNTAPPNAEPERRSPPAADPWAAAELATVESLGAITARQPGFDWAAPSAPVAERAPPDLPPPDHRAILAEPRHKSPAGGGARPAAHSGASPAEVERDFIRRFARGANVPEEFLAQRGREDLAEELGALMRIICDNLMQLLSARAAAKALARSGQRTMIQRTDNNPLKFMPSPEDAIKAVFGPRSNGYLDSRATFEATFADLQVHQLATFAAMQHALILLLDGLSPEAIEQTGGASRIPLLGSNKGKLWEQYVERWNAKASSHEHGMLNAFLALFAEHYDRESRARR